MVQESLQVTKTFPMFDVSRYDVHAIATSGRARGGLIVALQNRVFNAARVTVLCEEEYALFLRIEIPSSDFTLVVGNVYAPVHSPGFTSEILRTIGSQLDLISAQHPSASIVIAGNRPKMIFYLIHCLDHPCAVIVQNFHSLPASPLYLSMSQTQFRR
jgi:hypothetical protein